MRLVQRKPALLTILTLVGDGLWARIYLNGRKSVIVQNLARESYSPWMCVFRETDLSVVVDSKDYRKGKHSGINI